MASLINMAEVKTRVSRFFVEFLFLILPISKLEMVSSRAYLLSLNFNCKFIASAKPSGEDAGSCLTSSSNCCAGDNKIEQTSLFLPSS